MSKYDNLRDKIINMKPLSQIQQKNLQNKKTNPELVNSCDELNPDNIHPKLIRVDSKHKYWNNWKAVEEHVASFEFRRSPGRNCYFLVINEYNGKTLGILDVAADFLSLGPRDEHIGWDVDRRRDMNKHIANISMCVPTRFFGYNLAGGKLLTLLAASDEVADVWEDRYGDKLAGLTVTSLYGKSVQYNNLEYYKYLGKTKGQGTVHVPDDIYKEMRGVVEDFEGEIPGGRFTKGKNSRINIIRRACKHLGVNPEILTTHGNKRGIYWCDRNENSREWLRGEDSELIPRKGMDAESLTCLWREKHAKKRVKNLKSRGEFGILVE